MTGGMHDALRAHWPEYLMEGAGLGIFMVSACAVTALLEHPASPARQAIADPLARRVLIGLAMGLTAVGLIYSPWGRQSGAHLNPSVTFGFFRLGKIRGWDAVFYALFQFAGGLVGVLVAAAALGRALAHPSVNYVVTAPGPRGPAVAFAAELGISFVLMSVVLAMSNHPRLAPFTGLGAGALVALYISVEAPLSGMSMNPARTFGSALPAMTWTAIWTYLLAPPLGMLLAAELYARAWTPRRVLCAKLHHDASRRCIFRCGYAAARPIDSRLEEAHA